MTSDFSFLRDIRACVFDAYGTLFDVTRVARLEDAALGDKHAALSELWRAKQLQYSWLRGLGGRHADFWQVTGEALDFAMAALGLEDPALRERLMNLYLRIDAYPEVRGALEALRARGLKTAILSNGTPSMLAAAIENSGLGHALDQVLSVERAGVFKPHPSVYQLAVDSLGVSRERICFLSSNGWDAWSAKAFGFRVLWCNRTGQQPETLPWTPDGVLRDLSVLAQHFAAVS